MKPVLKRLPGASPKMSATVTLNKRSVRCVDIQLPHLELSVARRLQTAEALACEKETGP